MTQQTENKRVQKIPSEENTENENTKHRQYQIVNKLPERMKLEKYEILIKQTTTNHDSSVSGQPIAIWKCLKDPAKSVATLQTH